ncbi:EpsG family protein [Vibrio jasicida]|uniref:EpsG family protein n=2 Tax=Vibrio jasicida TaxID=766224 RepID=UPI0003A6E7A4|nr:EpsG family protein [Vibrio jasicida]
MNKNILSVVVFIIFAVIISWVSSFRNLESDLQNDTGRYNSYHSCVFEHSIANCSYLIGSPPYEIGLGSSMKLSHYAGIDFKTYLFFASLFFLFCLYYFFNSFTKFPSVCVLISLIHPMAIEALTNTIRQTVAFSFLLLFIGYEVRNSSKGRRRNIYLDVGITAFLFSFHTVVAFFYLIWVLSKFLNKHASRVFISVFCVSLICSIVIMPSLINYLPIPDALKFKLVYYMESDSGISVAFYQIGKVQFISFLYVIFMYWGFNKSLNHVFHIKQLFVFFLLLLSFSLFFSFTGMSYRMLLLPSLIFVGLMVYAIENKKDMVAIPIFLYVSIQLFYFVLNFDFNFRAFY